MKLLMFLRIWNEKQEKVVQTDFNKLINMKLKKK